MDIITAFEDSYIDLVVNDPSGKSNLGYGGNTETRYYMTTNLHYFGFNSEAPLWATRNTAIRCSSPWTGNTQRER